MEMKKKRFEVAANLPGGTVILQVGEFEPDTADIIRLNISREQAKHSLVAQEIKKALDRFQDALIEDFKNVPDDLKEKLDEYIPFSIWEDSKRFRALNKKIKKTYWKI